MGKSKQKISSALSAIERKSQTALRVISNKIFPQTSDLITAYSRSKNWISKNSLPNSGIKIHHKAKYAYPEVTGYFIPTLLNWGQRTHAEKYTAWLLSIQNKDGSWSDPRGQSPYVFDTGQILKGLIAFYHYKPSKNLEQAICAACDWILTRQDQTGRITTPNAGAWGNMVKETVHLYCLSPMIEAASLFNRPQYKDAAEKALFYYVNIPNILAFDQMAHFHAYVCEAFADLDKPHLAKQALAPILAMLDKNQAVTAYPDRPFACSTALFQLACTFYKLGDTAHGDILFKQGAALQNKSGGFFGSYGPGADYFPDEEISWAVKYFLDAYQLMIESSFDHSFTKIAPDHIEKNDGRYQFIKNNLAAGKTVLDIGCGKGRFLKNLLSDQPEKSYAGVDISSKILEFVPAGVTRIKGSILSIPVYDRTFDTVFTVEAIEHALDYKQALKEMARLVAPQGRLIIIDKRAKKLGQMNLCAWEQWYDENDLRKVLENLEFKVAITVGISYDRGSADDKLFFGIIADRKQ